MQFKLNDPNRLMYHNEPIWRDGAIVGHITSAMFGHTMGASLGMGYVKDPAGGLVTPDFVKSGTYEIEVACQRVSAEASLRPFYDPTSARMKV